MQDKSVGQLLGEKGGRGLVGLEHRRERVEGRRESLRQRRGGDVVAVGGRGHRGLHTSDCGGSAAKGVREGLRRESGREPGGARSAVANGPHKAGEGVERVRLARVGEVGQRGIVEKCEVWRTKQRRSSSDRRGGADTAAAAAPTSAPCGRRRHPKDGGRGGGVEGLDWQEINCED